MNHTKVGDGADSKRFVQIERAMDDLERVVRADFIPIGTSALMRALVIGLRLQVIADGVTDFATARSVVCLAARWHALIAALDPDSVDVENSSR